MSAHIVIEIDVNSLDGLSPYFYLVRPLPQSMLCVIATVFSARTMKPNIDEISRYLVRRLKAGQFINAKRTVESFEQSVRLFYHPTWVAKFKRAPEPLRK